MVAWRNRITGAGEESPDQLLANPMNFRRHPKHQQDALRGVLNEVGWVQDVIVNRTTGRLVDGHLRVELALRDGAATVPVKYVDLTEAEEALIIATFDPISALAFADAAVLEDLLHEVSTGDAAVQQLLADLAEREGVVDLGEADGDDAAERAETAPGGAESARLQDRFIVPPFSVLDARQGYWQARKRAWLALGIRSEIGRGEDLISSGASAVYGGGSDWAGNRGPEVGSSGNGRALDAGGRLTYVKGNRAIEDMDEVSAKILESGSGTSIFDPVLCELAYRWFAPPQIPHARVLDPFAGGSVRGLVASAVGLDYTGIDLSERQVAANWQQWHDLNPRLPEGSLAPRWIVGDSLDVHDLAPGTYDLLFTCPPYADLEVYSDDPRDLSTMDYDAFLATYREILARACRLLADDRFAVVVVGDVRAPQGHYRNFVSDTIAALQDAGLRHYNEAILVTPAGSLPLRAARQFQASRKLGKTHQNVIIAYKGDPRAIGAWGEVEAGEVPGDGDGEGVAA